MSTVGDDDFTIEDFLDSEVENIRHGPNNLARIDSEAMATVEQCSTLLKALSVTYGRVARLGHNDRYFKEWAKQHQLSGKDASDFLLKSTFVGTPSKDDAASAKGELERSTAVLVRALLLLRMRRDYLIGVSDLLKNRINQGLGSLRIQSESLALLRLMYDEPRIAREWLDADIGQSGRDFHNSHHSTLVGFVKDWNLKHYHDIASTVALHSRISGLSGAAQAAGGLAVVKGGVELSLLTGDTLDPAEFFLSVCYFLRFYDRAFSKIDNIVPEVAGDGDLKATLARFADAVRDRWKMFELRFPTLAKRFKAINATI